MSVFHLLPLKLTTLQRRALMFLIMTFVMTGNTVQAANPVSATVESETDSVQEDDAQTRGIRVPSDRTVEKALPVAAKVKVKKVWNTINAPDLTTPVEYSDEPAVRTITVPTSAYNSEVGQTDSSPFTTADGSQVRDGIVAANFLPHGTRLRIPDHFGNKVFEVHDRMNSRYTYKMDLWMLNKSDARKWGVRTVKVEILN
jgi:3D (Asp-Asp-Asp) domain-containing protein